jgi:PAS domain S-box-containing protein
VEANTLASERKSSGKLKDEIACSEKHVCSEPIRWKLLVPLMLVAFILISCLSGFMWWHQNQQLEGIIHSMAPQVSQRYEQLLEEETYDLTEEVNWIAQNEELMAALKEEDAEQLMNHSKSTYEQLSSTHHITHLYFQSPERVNILRMHNPGESGDVIDRFTTIEAERTRRISSGVELGVMGTFTLRVVKPVFEDDKLIGYIEFGKEIEDILNKVAEESNAELAFFIYKEELDRDNWESGMKMLDRDANWDRYPDQAMIYGTMNLSSNFDAVATNQELDTDHLVYEVEDDDRIWHSLVIPLFDASGRNVGYMCIMQDITEEKEAFLNILARIVIVSVLIFGLLVSFYYVILKKTDDQILHREMDLRESEDKFRKIFECGCEGIYVADIATKKFKYVNPALCQMFGYDEAELNQMCTNSICQHDDFQYQCSKLNSEDINELKMYSEIPCVKKDGTLIYVDGSVSAIVINGVNNALVFFTDVTSRKKASDAMREAKIAEDESNRVKNEFLANMSHELRTPLNSIIGFSDLLICGIGGGLNDKQKSYANNILTSGKYLLELINDVLDFSKVEAGKMELHYEDVDVSSVFNEIRDVIGSLAAEKNISLKCSVDEAVPSVYMDLVKFKQILFNLVNNSIKFTNDGGLVSCDAIVIADNLHVSVSDTGIGITENDKKKLFQPFTQLNSSSVKIQKGTGLGLTLVKKFVEFHGGDIWVDSVIGEGSSFNFTIPLTRAN